MYLSKRIRFLLLALLPIVAFGQIPVQRSPATVTVMDARLKANLNLGTPHYADTATANLWKGLDSLGNVITTGTNPMKFWMRDVDGNGTHKWAQITGSGGSAGIDDVLAIGQQLTADRSIDQNNNSLHLLTSTGGLSSAVFDATLSSVAGGTFFSLGATGSNQTYSSTGAGISNGFNWNATYSELFGSTSAGGGHSSRVRGYPDSLVLNNDVGYYRVRNLIASPDSSGLKPMGIDATGQLYRLSFWPGGTALGRNLLARNALRARNDTTITWNGNLDTPTVINGGGFYPIKFSGILNGVSFDENPKFNTVSVTGQVWTATDVNGNGHWANATGGGSGGGIGIDSVVTITSGSSGTVTNGYNVVRFNPSSVIASYTLTLPTTWHTSNNLLISFGGTITAGSPVVTSLTIVNGSGQTLLQSTIPTTANAGEVIQYHLIGTIDQRVN